MYDRCLVEHVQHTRIQPSGSSKKQDKTWAFNKEMACIIPCIQHNPNVLDSFAQNKFNPNEPSTSPETQYDDIEETLNDLEDATLNALKQTDEDFSCNTTNTDDEWNSWICVVNQK